MLNQDSALSDLMQQCCECCRQLLENLGFHDALPPEMLAEPSSFSSVDAAAASLEDVHLQNAGMGGDSFADGMSPRAENGDAFELRGMHQAFLWHCCRSVNLAGCFGM